MAVDWGYYDKEEFEKVNEKYLPIYGEGETKATQIVTAVNKLIYKWYNDGDVFDNTYYMTGWANDISDEANWLYENTKNAWKILNKIVICYGDDEYEELLKELAEEMLNEEFLVEQDKEEKVGSIYKCEGKFKYEEPTDEDDEYDDDDYEEEEEDY